MENGTGILSEHEPVNHAGMEGDDDKKSQDLIKFVNKHFKKAKSKKMPYAEKWPDYYKMFRGKQWKEKRPSFRHSEVINLIFQSIQSGVPVMLDSRPRIEFGPQNPEDRELAQILDDLIKSDWERLNWNMPLFEMVYDANIYGVGMASMKFKQDLNFGLGEIVFESEDPFHIYPDPDARDFNQRARYLCIAEPMSIDRIKREYPEKGSKVKADILPDELNFDKSDLDEVRFKSPVDRAVVAEGSEQHEASDQEQALVITMMMSPDFETVEEQNGDGTFSVKKKYPKGRVITIANNVVLSDEDELPYDDAKFPYAKLLNYILPREFWGISEIEQLEGPQKVFNKMVSFALDVLTLMGNPIWIVSSDSNVDVDEIQNQPGLILTKEPNSEVRREEGVQLQPYVLQLIDRMKSWFDDVSGVNDPIRGQNPAGVTAASAIESLKDSAQTRIRLKSKLLDMCLQDLGQMYMSRAFQFYNVPRVFKVTENQNSQRFFKFHVEHEPEMEDVEMMDEMGNPMIQQQETGQMNKFAVVRPFEETETGQFVPGEERKFKIMGDFDVKVSSGSSLPFAKAAKRTNAKELYQLAVIDEEEVLKAYEWPNWEEVLGRVNEKKAQAAQAEAMAQGGGVPPM